MAAVPSVLLNSGARIPAIGLGVYKSGPGEETYSAVLSALKVRVGQQWLDADTRAAPGASDQRSYNRFWRES